VGYNFAIVCVPGAGYGDLTALGYSMGVDTTVDEALDSYTGQALSASQLDGGLALLDPQGYLLGNAAAAVAQMLGRPAYAGAFSSVSDTFVFTLSYPDGSGRCIGTSQGEVILDKGEKLAAETGGADLESLRNEDALIELLIAASGVALNFGAAAKALSKQL